MRAMILLTGFLSLFLQTSNIGLFPKIIIFWKGATVILRVQEEPRTFNSSNAYLEASITSLYPDFTQTNNFGYTGWMKKHYYNPSTFERTVCLLNSSKAYQCLTNFQF